MKGLKYNRHCEPAKQAWRSPEYSFVALIRLPQSLCSFAMTAIIKCIICFTIVTLCGCGIRDYPISPSEAKLPKQKQSLFPIETEKKEGKNPNIQKKSYVDAGTLFQAGGFYSAGFGLENDTLDDVFERIKPKSARPKRRFVTPLDR